MSIYSDYVLYYSIYAFLGWLMESVYASVKQKRIINRGFLRGFFLPIYGYGALLILFTSNWITNILPDNLAARILIVVLSIAQVTALELIAGFALDKLFKLKLWDYSDKPFHLKGYICLQCSLLWGVLAYFLLQVVHPYIADRLTLLSDELMIIMSLCMILYFITDTIFSIYKAIKNKGVERLKHPYSINRMQ